MFKYYQLDKRQRLKLHHSIVYYTKIYGMDAA